VIDFKRHISIFLACALLLVAFIAAPKIEIIFPTFPSQQEINKGDHVKLQGCTKNELTSTQQNIDLSLKEKKSIKYFSGFTNIVAMPVLVKECKSTELLDISTAIQSALKKLIFPFHTFW